METSESAPELREIEEKDNVMENLYAIFQIREAVSRLQMFVNISREKSSVTPYLIKLQSWKGRQFY